MAKLTKTYIDKITPPASGYDLHWYEQDRGFGLRVTKDGKRTYIAQGRVNGKEARISIGPHGVFTADQAREVAREHLRSMRQGIDPRTVAKERTAETVCLRDVADAYKRNRPQSGRCSHERTEKAAYLGNRPNHSTVKSHQRNRRPDRRAALVSRSRAHEAGTREVEAQHV